MKKNSFSHDKWCFWYFLGQILDFLEFLKQETDLFFITLFHCLIILKHLCSSFLKQTSWKNHGYGCENCSENLCKWYESSPVYGNVERSRRQWILMMLCSLPMRIGWVMEEFYKDMQLTPFKLSWNKTNACQIFNNQGQKWQCDLHFVINITLHTNKLNLKLQGKEKLIFDLARQLWEFILKLKLFIIQVNDDSIHFSTMNQCVECCN